MEELKLAVESPPGVSSFLRTPTSMPTYTLSSASTIDGPAARGNHVDVEVLSSQRGPVGAAESEFPFDNVSDCERARRVGN